LWGAACCLQWPAEASSHTHCTPQDRTSNTFMNGLDLYSTRFRNIGILDRGPGSSLRSVKRGPLLGDKAVSMALQRREVVAAARFPCEADGKGPGTHLKCILQLLWRSGATTPSIRAFNHNCVPFARGIVRPQPSQYFALCVGFRRFFPTFFVLFCPVPQRKAAVSRRGPAPTHEKFPPPQSGMNSPVFETSPKWCWLPLLVFMRPFLGFFMHTRLRHQAHALVAQWRPACSGCTAACSLWLCLYMHRILGVCLLRYLLTTQA
jgi:hypothetical protein